MNLKILNWVIGRKIDVVACPIPLTHFAFMDKKRHLQVWDYLLDNDELDLADVIIISKVISLSTTKNGCYITNGALGKLIRIKEEANVSRRITKLERLGYIKCKHIAMDKNSNKTKRFIYPTYENGLSLKTSRVVADDKGGCSVRQGVVVADDKGCMSLATSNNTIYYTNLLNQPIIPSIIPLEIEFKELMPEEIDKLTGDERTEYYFKRNEFDKLNKKQIK
jgi:DNA-binding Lrp family transcriptional regulator